MKRFKICVEKHWVEPGEVEVEADDEDDAREKAKDLLSSDDDSINWHSSNMEPGETTVESVEEIE